MINQIPGYHDANDHRRCDTCAGGRSDRFLVPDSCGNHCDEPIEPYGTCPNWKGLDRKSRDYRNETYLWECENTWSCYDCGYGIEMERSSNIKCPIDGLITFQKVCEERTCDCSVPSHRHCPKCDGDLFPDEKGFFHPCEKCDLEWDDYYDPDEEGFDDGDNSDLPIHDDDDLMFPDEKDDNWDWEE